MKEDLPDRQKQYTVDSGLSPDPAELAARALGCEPAHIAKSLTFMVNDKPVMIITSGDVKIDNTKYKARFGIFARSEFSLYPECRFNSMKPDQSEFRVVDTLFEKASVK